MNIHNELIKVIQDHINEINKYIDFIDTTLEKLNKNESENYFKCKEHLKELEKYMLLLINERKNIDN